MDADLIERVAEHIGAAQVVEDKMKCPECGGDFGPTLSLGNLSYYTDGYLPGAPLLMGVCLDCDHTTKPTATPWAEEA